MAVITSRARAAFREQGYVVIPAVPHQEQLAAGREMVTAMLAAEPPDLAHVGPYSLWPRSGEAGHKLLDFYRDAGIGQLAAGLLRPDLTVRGPDFAQLAGHDHPAVAAPGRPAC